MTPTTRRVLFLLFFLSGFASLVYQVVWTRLAFAAFGIITPVLSVVLSVFMLGLAVGSWAGGKAIGTLTRRTGRSAVWFYGLAEVIVGLGAFVVPRLFAMGERVLLSTGETNSYGYLALSAVVLAISILPWCVCMGMTFPLMMAYVREKDPGQEQSFSYLYLANVLGAMAGTFLTAVVFVELLGFRHTLWLAALANFSIALVSGWLGMDAQPSARAAAGADQSPNEAAAPVAGKAGIKWLLFSTGFVAMAMEVVWTRAFTPVLKTQVYSFALIVVVYLGATFAGSWWYRRQARLGQSWGTGLLLSALAIAALLPVLANDTRLVTTNWLSETFDLSSAVMLMAGIVPFCALLGYLTPSLIDQGAAGRPAAAGRLYAINVLGCILGPLVAAYLLLPYLSERYALILLSLPMLALYFGWAGAAEVRRQPAAVAAYALTLAWACGGTRDFEAMLRRSVVNFHVRRDYAASTITFGEGLDKMLLVNGVGMTRLTPLAKQMTHLPMAFHHGPAKSALVICFGMGTSFRSALSWGADATVVELVPGVTQSFGDFHADAAEVEKNPRAHIVVDDGRRFLQRTRQKFDVIVVDPPPPVEAAGSSLLFSEEFFRAAQGRLNPGGILQMWFPGGDALTAQAVLRSAVDVFPHVRGFVSMAHFGVHILASDEPIDQATAQELVSRMPEAARRDMVEWEPQAPPDKYLALTVTNEVILDSVLNPNPRIALTDDHPYNEYFLLRRGSLSSRAAP